MRKELVPLVVALIALVVLPFAILGAGLTLKTATDVVILSLACLGLNILVGSTGLVSFGHGAWLGLAAYAFALTQRHWWPGALWLPVGFALLFVVLTASLMGALILRRRGVYFSTSSLRFSARSLLSKSSARKSR